jgi:hypothetical protein
MPIALLLAAAVLIFRLAPLAGEEVARLLANLSPLAAVGLCGAAFARRGDLKWVAVAAFGSFFVSDIVLNLAYGASPLSAFTLVGALGLAISFGLGTRLRGTSSAFPVFGATIAGTVAFHLLTNSFSWLTLPGYPTTVAGWFQAQVIGLPGFPPTYLFFLRSLFGNLVFTAAFLLAFRPDLLGLKSGVPAFAKQPSR